MNWRPEQADWRDRYLAGFDMAEVDRYEALVGQLSRDDENAYLSDLGNILRFREAMRVLDVGAGTGAMSGVLSRMPGLELTALEPIPAMLAKLKNKVHLQGVHTVQGFCDGIDDRHHFQAEQFDAIVSRQVVNGLFDPLTAFENWHYWLASGGAIVVIDGLYGRAAWSGAWEQDVDVLPLSACQSTALIPYLLERIGFRIEAIHWMYGVNKLPSTKTKRYAVVARKRT